MQGQECPAPSQRLGGAQGGGKGGARGGQAAQGGSGPSQHSTARKGPKLRILAKVAPRTGLDPPSSLKSARKRLPQVLESLPSCRRRASELGRLAP